MSDFEGLKALVTGGASGIGLATARAAGRARRPGRRPRPGPVDGATKPLLGYRADVTDDASVRAAVAAAVADLGGLDVLVNNAGIGAQGTVEDNDDDEWHRVLDVNVARHGPRDPRRPAPPAAVRARGDRQHLLDRRHRRPAAAGAVLAPARAPCSP